MKKKGLRLKAELQNRRWHQRPSCFGSPFPWRAALASLLSLSQRFSFLWATGNNAVRFWSRPISFTGASSSCPFKWNMPHSWLRFQFHFGLVSSGMMNLLGLTAEVHSFCISLFPHFPPFWGPCGSLFPAFLVGIPWLLKSRCLLCAVAGGADVKVPSFWQKSVVYAIVSAFASELCLVTEIFFQHVVELVFFMLYSSLLSWEVKEFGGFLPLPTGKKTSLADCIFCWCGTVCHWITLTWLSPSATVTCWNSGSQFVVSICFSVWSWNLWFCIWNSYFVPLHSFRWPSLRWTLNPLSLRREIGNLICLVVRSSCQLLLRKRHWESYRMRTES